MIIPRERLRPHTELLLVCESIIEDGELTYDELYRLADWLNNHHEVCHHWPGNPSWSRYRGFGQTAG
jgi:hypothetical protein